MKRYFVIPALALFLSACSNTPIQPPGDSHLRAEKVGAGDTATIPSPVQQTLAVPKPRAVPKVETYSVVVNNVRVQELLFALARDAKLNVDIHPGIEGMVTLNAINQTLQQLLNRIAKQVDIRWEMDGPNLAVMPDSPFLRTYKVDYVNMSRDATSTVTVSSQIATQGIGGAGGNSNTNNSESKIVNTTQNKFWETLKNNITAILNEEGETIWERKCNETSIAARNSNESNSGSRSNTTVVPAVGAPVSSTGPGNESGQKQSGSAASNETTCGKYEPKGTVMANAEAGIINIRATGRQHEKVREFLDQVMTSAQRQVLIEATIAEVELKDNYQQGINWERIGSGLATAALGTGVQVSQAVNGLFTLTAKRTFESGGTFESTIKLLEDYGNVKVLSSPKLSVLNNQTAMLRVVTNNVYFTIKSDVAAGVSGSAPVKAVTTTPQTVAVGFVMAVTPQISDNNTITLNVRPSITSVVNEIQDPNPELTKSDGSVLVSKIPVIRTREMESILRINSGNIAVMGGLMEDRLTNNDQGLPTLSSMPLFGPLFQQRNDTRSKTELVIFLRPVIIKDASLQGDYSEYRNQLPGQDFFEKGNIGPPQQRLNNPWGAAQ